MKKLQISLIFTILYVFSSCSTDNENIVSNALDFKIKAGQNFGFCIGNCFQEIEIDGKKITLTAIERNTRGANDEGKVSKYSEELSDSELLAIQKEIDIKKFKTLDEVYGCPDCADGGSEWIEILKSGDDTHKVTFEYGKDVKGIENLINLLRNKREALSKKYIKN